MFEATFTDNALEDLQYLKKSEQNVILDGIQQQLATEPLVKTRNRKPLRDNKIAAWELRLGALRVFYDVNDTENQVVVRAIGRKEHNKLFIRGKEFLL